MMRRGPGGASQAVWRTWTTRERSGCAVERGREEYAVKITDIKVLTTFIDGKIVYQRE